MAESIIKILESAFSIWDQHEKTKYIDQLMGLKKEFYAEYDKPQEDRSDAILDDVLLRLRILGESFCAAVGAANSKVQPGSTGA